MQSYTVTEYQYQHLSSCWCTMSVFWTTLHSDFMLIYLSLSSLCHSWKSIWIFRKGISHRTSWRRKWKAISRSALSVIKQENMLWAQRNSSEILVLCKHRCFCKHQIYDSKYTESQTLNTVDSSGSKIWLDESNELKPAQPCIQHKMAQLYVW